MLDEAAARHFHTDQLQLNGYLLAFVNHDASGMQQILTESTGKVGEEDEIFATQGDTEAYHGRLSKAREWMRRAMDSARREDDSETAAEYSMDTALEEVEAGRLTEAREDLDAGLKLAKNRDVQVEAALGFARLGDASRAHAIADDLRKNFPSDTLVNALWLPAIEAALDLHEGNQASALDRLQTASSYELSTAIWGEMAYPIYLRGQAFLMAKDGKQAAVEFQKIADHTGLVSNRMVGALSYLCLGRAYTLSGDRAMSRKNYDQFFALWHDADPDLPLLKQAKSEYAKISAQ